MAIISNRFYNKLLKKRKRRDWFFMFTVRKMKRIIKKIYSIYFKENSSITPIGQLNVYPEDFKKMSNEKIERGLDIMLGRGDLMGWKKKNIENANAYLLVLNIENLSQGRFQVAKRAKLNRIPQEIDLNKVELEPIKQSADNVYTKPGKQTSETIADKPTNQNTKDADLTPEQEPYEDDAEDEEDYSTPF